MAEIKCYHCGDTCGKYPVVWDGKYFCCHGCKSVYQLLNEHNLNTYYKLYETPGIKADESIHEEFAYFDHPEIESQLLDFDNGKHARVSFFIPSIHCSSCIWLLENLNRLHQGIFFSQVNFTRKTVSITYQKDKIKLSQLIQLLNEIHYKPQISLKDLDKKNKTPPKSRKILYQIGIAGFAFGNIMIYALPWYLPGKEGVDFFYKNFVGWLSFGLSLPVVFYSASDYLQSGFKNLRKGILNIDLPIATGILALFFFSSYSLIFKEAEHLYFDSLSGLVFFLLIGKWFQNKTYSALSFERDYRSYFPVAVTRAGAEGNEYVPLEKLKPDDEILVRNRELIPADGILLSEEALIDYSFITGESIPVKVQQGQPVFAGGRQIGFAIKIKINKEVDQSRLTQIWNEQNVVKSKKKQLKKVSDIVSRYFVVAVFIIALFTAIYWMIVNPEKALFAAISVLIIACPCALALSVPFAFGNAMRWAGNLGMYLRNSDVVEQMANTDTIVFDKTGTLTEKNFNIAGYKGEALTDEEKILVRSLAINSVHPLSHCIAEYLKDFPVVQVNDFKEIISEGVKAAINGHEVKLGNVNFADGQNFEVNNISGSQVFVSLDGRCKGYFIIQNKLRDNLKETIQQLKEYQMYVVSGDNDTDRERLGEIFPPETHFLFHQSPEDKKKFVENLKSEKRNVLYMGDGLNDAGALMESDAGISIADNIFVFSPASDAILEARKFSLLPALMEYFKKSINIVKISYFISFLYNTAGLYFAVRGMLSPVLAAVLMPLSSISVVVITTFSTTFLARKMLK